MQHEQKFETLELNRETVADLTENEAEGADGGMLMCGSHHNCPTKGCWTTACPTFNNCPRTAPTCSRCWRRNASRTGGPASHRPAIRRTGRAT